MPPPAPAATATATVRAPPATKFDIDKLLSARNTDGSFVYSVAALPHTGCPGDAFVRPCSECHVSEEWLFNACIAHQLQQLGVVKYSLILKNLKAWLVRQCAGGVVCGSALSEDAIMEKVRVVMV